MVEQLHDGPGRDALEEHRREGMTQVVVGSLLGIVIGVVAQGTQARRGRRWERDESFTAEKRVVYARFLRAISASYAQAIVGQRERSEDGNLHAATAEIELLRGPRVAAAARYLRDSEIDAHSWIAARAVDESGVVPAVNVRRLASVEIFKADLKSSWCAAGPIAAAACWLS
ncbi:hypothetical protein [Pseudofrankia inefficax]|nr:hypothetical protein [Pseudofrankia inefficax]